MLAVALLLMPVAAQAQQAVKVYRIGSLSVSSAQSAFRVLNAMEEHLSELGYVRGSNVIYEHRFAGGRAERLPRLAQELAALNLDVVVAGANAAIAAARQAMPRTPIVMGYAIDPVGVGFVASLSHPGGNITGVTFDVTVDTWGKRLQLAKEIAPRVSQVAVLWNPDAPGMSAAWKATEDGAATLGVKLQSLAVRRLEDFDSAFTAIALRRPGALLVFADPLTYTRRRDIVALVARHRVPAIYAIREATEEGGLISYAISNVDLFRRAGDFVDRILKGAKPGELPVEQPTKLELVINLKTARTLGLTIPQPLLLQAAQVIE